MAEGVSLRRVGAPVVAGSPSGVRIRTRIHLTEAEAAALGAVGSFLGGVYRGELAGRVRLGVLDRQSRAGWRAERKQAVTGVSSSRWAGAITRAVEDQYQRRLAVLRSRLAAAENALTAGRPSITVGGKRLWRNRNHLEAAELSIQQWQSRWDAARMFLTADGETGKAGGNETIRVNDAGQLRIKVPPR